MRLPLRDYKNVSPSIIEVIKKERLKRNNYSDGQRREKDELDELPDLEYVKNVLSKRADDLDALMVSEKERRRSFRSTWEKYEDKVRGIELAKAGFYFLNDEDRVKCAFCSGMIEKWEKGDEPMERHRRNFSFCKFIKGKCSENIPFDDIGLEHLYEKACRDPDEDEALHDPTPKDFRILLNVEPGTPYYRLRTKRDESFKKGWPSGPNINKNESLVAKLCDAGFFNSDPNEPTIDSTECFFCGGTMEDWIGDEDPWAEHAKWFYKCPFLIKNQGPDYISSVRDTMSAQDRHESENMCYRISTLDQQDDSVPSIGEKKRAIKDSLSYKFAYEELEKSEELIMQAHKVNNWNVYENPADLLQCMYGINDENIDPNTYKRTEESQQEQAQAANGPEMNEKNLKDALTCGDELNEKQKVLFTTDMTCRICMDQRCEAAFLPCGCFALCGSCCTEARLPGVCPVCKKVVEKAVPAKLS